MRIDAHQHFWDPARLPYPWMPPEPYPLHRPFLPETLGIILRNNRFDGSLAVQATNAPEEAPWLLDLATQHDFILGVVAWVDLKRPDLGRTLDQLQRHPKFKGVRHPVPEESGDWLFRADGLSGLDELARRQLPFDLLLQSNQLALLPRLADRLPSLSLVLNHAGKPPIAAREIEPWASDLARAAEIPRLTCKLSGLIAQADRAAWTSADLMPYVQHALTCFGPDRLLFGSDWPHCLLAGNWKRSLAAFTQACGPLSVETRSKILGETAMRVYGIEQPAHPDL